MEQNVADMIGAIRSSAEYDEDIEAPRLARGGRGGHYRFVYRSRKRCVTVLIRRNGTLLLEINQPL